MFSLHFFHSKLCTMWLFCISSAMFPDNLQFFKAVLLFIFFCVLWLFVATSLFSILNSFQIVLCLYVFILFL